MKIYNNQEIERTEFAENNIEFLLAEPNSQLAEQLYLPEKVTLMENNIKCCKSKTALRLLKYADDKPVSILVVILKNNRIKNHMINMVYTLPEYRSHGYANQLLDLAKTLTKGNLTITNILSDDGIRLFKPEMTPSAKRKMKF